MPIPEKPTLVAPLWHTGLVLVYVLVPRTWWFIHGPLRQFAPQTLSGFDVLFIALYGGVVALVCLGMSFKKRPLEDLIGRGWTGWQSGLRDVGLGMGLWLAARYIDRVIYYLAPSSAPSLTHSH